MPTTPRAALAGSERSELTESHAFGPRIAEHACDPTEVIEATVYLRDQKDSNDVINALNRHGFSWRTTFAKTIKVRGPICQMAEAFGAKLQRSVHENGEYRARTGPLMLPESVVGKIQAVLGLDNRPAAKPHFRTSAGHAVEMRAAGVGSLWPAQVAKACNFPKGNGDGAGLYIGIGSLGGGFKLSDLQAAAKANGVPLLDVQSVSVDGATNKPGDDADVENLLDAQTICGIIAAAGLTKAHVRIFFAPNTSSGFVNCQLAMSNWKDPQTGARLSCASWSWGSAEANNTPMQMTVQDNAVATGQANGVTTFAASGDNGSSDGLPGVNVDFPASSPHVVGVGGTRLVVNADGSRAAETVWHNSDGGATGGGTSTVYAVPDYQSAYAGPGKLQHRGVPDVAVNADPVSGYRIIVNGQEQVVGGTSGAAPAMAALVAILSTWAGKPMGSIHPLLYANPTAFFDVVQGNNGKWSAGPGYDVCTGLGVPDGTKLLAAMKVVTLPPVLPPPTTTPPTLPVNAKDLGFLEVVGAYANFDYHAPARAGDVVSFSPKVG